MSAAPDTASLGFEPVLEVRVISVTGVPEIAAGDDLVQLIGDAVAATGVAVGRGDVFVVTHKVVSKAEGAVVDLGRVAPSVRATEWAAEWKKDPRVIEVVLRESAQIVRMERGVIVSETKHGLICANAGVDTSNVPVGYAALLPVDPDRSAREMCRRLGQRFGVPIGVIVSDTFGRPWREGQTNVAIGVAGLHPLADYRGHLDSFGRRLEASMIAVADELAGAAELVMGKALGVPVVLITGMGFGTGSDGDGSGRALLRPPQQDLFR